MKKIFILIVSLLVCQIGYATITSASEAVDRQKMKEAYQEGLRAAEEGKRNQQLWAEGKGDPKMADAYQQGLMAAEEMKAKQREWDN